MAQRTLDDGSSGDVVIRSGPPAAGGGSGGGFGGGGNRVGASGAFAGVSRRTKNARRRAKQQYLATEQRKRAQAAAAEAQAQEQLRKQSRQQVLAGWIPQHNSFRATADQRYFERNAQLAPSLEQEMAQARRHLDSGSSSERWQLYLISKEKSEIDGLIAHKTSEVSAKTGVAHSFDGHDALTRSIDDYLARLDQFGDALENGHKIWQNAYNAAHEARLLSAQIDALAQKSSALSSLHAEQTIVWREREAVWERQRQIAEQRDARVRFKQQADVDVRVERVRQAQTLVLPAASSVSAASVLFNPKGLWVGGAVDGLALSVTRAVALLGAGVSGAVGTLSLSQAAIFIGGMTYPSELGNAELTPGQRSRLFHAVGVPAQALDLHDRHELQAAADAGGSVEVEYRLKLLAVEQDTGVVVTRTGGEIDPRVPVVNAALDPLTGQYSADIPGSPARHLQITLEATPQVATANQARLAVTEPQVQDIAAGVDLRIQDCIVCVPGLEPIYLSFSVPPMGTGVVTGTGQAAALDWWKAASQASGAAIPTQVGELFQGREFKSFEAFDEALWGALGEHPLLTAKFDELNKKRIEQGLGPYAPKNTWVGENRTFELRYQERPQFWSDPYNLDRISIKVPNTAVGWLGIVPADVPWPIPPAATWKPLVPPGSEHLGSTTSPATPIDPLVYPGKPAIPVLPQNETFPAVDEGEIGASIPGFPGDMELPSSDALFRDRRDDPGVATGVGQVVSGVWLGDAARGQGVPIPLQVADQLRDKEFTNFHRFREAFWKVVAEDAILQQQFTAHNLKRMREGLSPYPRLADQSGGRKTFELHHDVEVSMGGDVYGIDNISVMTPQRHIQLHRERKNHDL